MITLTMKDEKRLEVRQRLFRGEVTVLETSLILGISERQCYRVIERFTLNAVLRIALGKFVATEDKHLRSRDLKSLKS
jgi:predicted thioesterase